MVKVKCMIILKAITKIIFVNVDDSIQNEKNSNCKKRFSFAVNIPSLM